MAKPIPRRRISARRSCPTLKGQIQNTLWQGLLTFPLGLPQVSNREPVGRPTVLGRRRPYGCPPDPRRCECKRHNPKALRSAFGLCLLAEDLDALERGSERVGTDRFAAVGAGDRIPRLPVDRTLDEPDRAIHEEHVDSARVVRAGVDRSDRGPPVVILV